MARLEDILGDSDGAEGQVAEGEEGVVIDDHHATAHGRHHLAEELD